MKDQQSCIFVFVACLTILSSNSGTSPDVTTVFHTRAYGRFKEIQSNLRRKKLNVRTPIQFRREGQPQHFKRLFFLKNRPIHFHINRTIVIRPVKRNQLSFPALKQTSHFLPQSTVSPRSDSSSEANSRCFHSSDA